MRRLEDQMIDRRSILQMMGLGSNLSVWCHLVDSDFFQWTVFFIYENERRQVTAESWELVLEQLRPFVALTLETREQLLSL